MKPEMLLESLAKIAVWWFPLVAGAVTWLITRENRAGKDRKLEIEADLEKRKSDNLAAIAIAKENSAGAAAIMELMEKDKEIHEKIEELKNNIEKKDQAKTDEIRRLADKITEFTFKAIEVLGGNINKK